MTPSLSSTLVHHQQNYFSDIQLCQTCIHHPGSFDWQDSSPYTQLYGLSLVYLTFRQWKQWNTDYYRTALYTPETTSTWTRFQSHCFSNLVTHSDRNWYTPKTINLTHRKGIWCMLCNAVRSAQSYTPYNRNQVGTGDIVMIYFTCINWTWMCIDWERGKKGRAQCIMGGPPAPISRTKGWFWANPNYKLNQRRTS